MAACPELALVVIIFILFLVPCYPVAVDIIDIIIDTITNRHRKFSFEMPGEAGVGAVRWVVAHSRESPVGPLSCSCRTLTQASRPAKESDSLKIIAWPRSVASPGRAPFQASLAGPGCFCATETRRPLGILHPEEREGRRSESAWIMRGRASAPSTPQAPAEKPWEGFCGADTATTRFPGGETGAQKGKAPCRHTANWWYGDVSGSLAVGTGPGLRPLDGAEGSGPGVLGWKGVASWGLTRPQGIRALESLHLGGVRDTWVMARSRLSLTQRAGQAPLGRSLAQVGSQSPKRPNGCLAGPGRTEITA